MMLKPAPCLLAAVVLAACAPRVNYPPPAPPQGPSRPVVRPQFPPLEEENEPVRAPAPRTMAAASGPAVVALLDRGEQLAAAGDYQRAAASVERALDLEPRNAFVYYRLAGLRLQQGNPDQAEALARKSNSLAVDNPYLQARNWALIAKTRSLRGDTVGAAAATSRADYYRNHSP